MHHLQFRVVVLQMETLWNIRQLSDRHFAKLPDIIVVQTFKIRRIPRTSEITRMNPESLIHFRSLIIRWKAHRDNVRTKFRTNRRNMAATMIWLRRQPSRRARSYFSLALFLYYSSRHYWTPWSDCATRSLAPAGRRNCICSEWEWARGVGPLLAAYRNRAQGGNRGRLTPRCELRI